MLHKARLAVVAAIVVSIMATVSAGTAQADEADIPFSPYENTKLKDPDNPTVRFRVDLAKVEHDMLMISSPEELLIRLIEVFSL